MRGEGNRPEQDPTDPRNQQLRALTEEVAILRTALEPFLEGFNYDPGHSDLDNEQSISVRVELGDWRRLRRCLSAPSPTGEALGELVKTLEWYADCGQPGDFSIVDSNKEFVSDFSSWGRKAKEALAKLRELGIACA